MANEIYFVMSSDGPVPIEAPEPTGNPVSKPFPPKLWRITPGVNGGLPYTGLMLVDTRNGAFFDCHKLRKVRIPNTVRFIGTNAFSGTALTSVTIPEDCTYSETSFPEGCEVSVI